MEWILDFGRTTAKAVFRLLKILFQSMLAVATFPLTVVRLAHINIFQKKKIYKSETDETDPAQSVWLQSYIYFVVCTLSIFYDSLMRFFHYIGFPHNAHLVYVNV